jgi:4-amino-4-deoxy-L-arabinose transferase-like glycosyltransferase
LIVFFSIRRRRNLCAAIGTAFAVLICLFSNLAAIGLLGPDEPRYAWIARAMAQTGDWITPRLYGQPWFEKPVLYYWTAAIGFRLHFSAEWAARLPSAFAALATALAIGWLAWRHYRDEGGFWRCAALVAPLMFATSAGAIGFARAATPDMLFSASLALSMACAACVLSRGGALRIAGPKADCSPGHDNFCLILFGAFVGLALLAKGPAAILLAGGAIGIWALATKHWRAAIRLAHPWVIVAFAIVGLPWYILCSARNPEFLRVFILRHNFERYLTPVFQHIQPFWFFLPVTLAALLPWTIFLIPALLEGRRILREKSWTNSPGFFFACWAVFPVLFFSFSQSKLPSYILPALPPLALLCAVGAVRSFSGTRALSMALSLGIAAFWVAAAFFLRHSLRALPPSWLEAAPYQLSANVILALASLVTLLLVYSGIRKKLGRTVFLTTLCVIAAVVYTNLRVLPAIEPLYSARWHYVFLARDLHPDRIFTYDVKRSWTYGLAFYFARELPEWSPNDPRAALVLTTPQGLQEMIRLGRVRGPIEEPYGGLLYVPAFPEPSNR